MANARVRNLNSMKRIDGALLFIGSPFTSIDMASITGLHPIRVSRLLQRFDCVEKVPVNRKDGLRCVYRIVGDVNEN